MITEICFSANWLPFDILWDITRSIGSRDTVWRINGYAHGKPDTVNFNTARDGDYSRGTSGEITIHNGTTFISEWSSNGRDSWDSDLAVYGVATRQHYE